jgi:hypothetical protein
MNKTIENIWKEGFTNKDMVIPKINDFYNKKSISLVEKVINTFKKEITFLIPLGVCFFLYNIWLDNDNAAFWGAVSALPCLVWYYLGKRQIKSIEDIDYKASSYQYLVSIKEKLERIKRFNKRLILSSVPISLLPMLIYTYYNQRGKSIGEIFGVEGLDLPTETIFLILPIVTLFALLFAEIYFKTRFVKNSNKIGSLINEIEELSK